MNSRPLSICFGVLVAFTLSCHEATQPSPGNIVAFQVPGCGLARAVPGPSDSCFSYEFRMNLLVDFCALGNCCPDSDRFSFQYAVANDTIVLTIADTAAQLCRCQCPYRLHAEISGLSKNSYLLLCTRQDYSSQYLLYEQRVWRKLPGL